MAVSTTTSSIMTNYPAIFRSYIVRSTEHILSKTRQSPLLLTDQDRNQALHTLSYALKLPEAWSITSQLLLMLAPKMEQAGYRDEWIPYLEEGIHQSQFVEDIETAAEIQLELGILYQLQSKYETAYNYLQESIANFERSQSPLRQAKALNRLANVVRLQRQFDKAVNLIEMARQLLTEKDAELAYSYFVLGLIALDKRIWQEAVEYSDKALALWEQSNDQRMMGRSFITLGAALLSMQRHQEAIEVCQRAISLFENIQDPIYQAIAQMHLGNVYLALQQPLAALELYQPAKQLFRKAQTRRRLAMVNHNIGLAYRQLQEWDKAREAYLLALNLHQEIGNTALAVDTIDGLGLSYLEQEQYQKAIDIFREGLNRLAQIRDEPCYSHLHEMVSTHLQEAVKAVE